MSFGALSEEARTALSRGAQMAGIGICSGEGGMLSEEQSENSRYFFELASARFGWDLDLVASVQAFHFNGGRGAKTGTGGHLPGDKVQGKFAEVRGLDPANPRSPLQPSQTLKRQRISNASRMKFANDLVAFLSGSNRRRTTLRTT